MGFYERGGGTSAAYSGEEYRQELRRGLEAREAQITSLPWAAGSGFRGKQPGYFFCARTGEEVFMRFVPDGDEPNEEAIVGDTLKCLKRIECTAETERSLPDTMRDTFYDAWEIARRDTFQQWQAQTDPRNVQPDIRKLFREVSEYIRNNWPEELTQDELIKTIESVEAPWGRRYERELREVYEDESVSGIQKTYRLLEKIDDLGLQPYEAPDPAPPIEEDEVKLICWMVVASKINDDEDRPKLMSQVTL